MFSSFRSLKGHFLKSQASCFKLIDLVLKSVENGSWKKRHWSKKTRSLNIWKRPWSLEPVLTHLGLFNRLAAGQRASEADQSIEYIFPHQILSPRPVEPLAIDGLTGNKKKWKMLPPAPISAIKAKFYILYPDTWAKPDFSVSWWKRTSRRESPLSYAAGNQ